MCNIQDEKNLNDNYELLKGNIFKCVRKDKA